MSWLQKKREKKWSIFEVDYFWFREAAEDCSATFLVLWATEFSPGNCFGGPLGQHILFFSSVCETECIWGSWVNTQCVQHAHPSLLFILSLILSTLECWVFCSVACVGHIRTVRGEENSDRVGQGGQFFHTASGHVLVKNIWSYMHAHI